MKVAVKEERERCQEQIKISIQVHRLCFMNNNLHFKDVIHGRSLLMFQNHIRPELGGV